MEDSTKDISKDQLDAGRGVAKDNNSNSNNNTTKNHIDEDERLDDRARKAGY